MARNKKPTSKQSEATRQTIQSNWNFSFIMALWLKKLHHPKSKKVPNVKDGLLTSTVAHPGLFLEPDHFLRLGDAQVMAVPEQVLANARQEVRAAGIEEVWN